MAFLDKTLSVYDSDFQNLQTISLENNLRAAFVVDDLIYCAMATSEIEVYDLETYTKVA